MTRQGIKRKSVKRNQAKEVKRLQRLFVKKPSNFYKLLGGTS